MMKSKWFMGIVLLSILGLFSLGCTVHPEGLDSPRHLTDDEKNKVIEVALSTPEVQKQLESKAPYTAEIYWLAITWNGSQWSAYYHIDTDWENDPNLNNVPDSAYFYPYVITTFMEPAWWQVSVAVDLDNGKAVLVHEYPAHKGPAQPGPDEYEISPAPIHEASVSIAESYPPQVFLYIMGGLSDGCTTFHEIAIEREGNNIHVEVSTQRPVGVYCPAVYTYFEKNIGLGTDFVSGETYYIHVNDYSTSFTMQ